MRKQNLVARTLALPENLVRVQTIAAAAGPASRTEIASRVCSEFGFFDARKRPQLATCLQAFRSLEARGLACLPAPKGSRRRSAPKAKDPLPIAQPVNVPERVDLLADLEVIPAIAPHQRQIWHRLVACEHPFGSVRHVGAQMRYLIVSEHGILGALGFAASALALRDRDQWLGWDSSTRLRHLHRIVGLSRFLIRDSARCRNLATKALSLCLRRLPADFLKRYAYSPVLVETFVDSSQHSGSCFAAANFTRVGRTVGRGRFTPRGTEVPPKDIFVRPLNRHWRRRLGLLDSAPATLRPGALPLAPLQPADGLALAEWADNEFGLAPLGDVRLTRRLVLSVRVQSAKPMVSFPRAAEGDLALVRGHYRFIDHPKQSPLTVGNLLATHRRRTQRRMLAAPGRVLLVQDGSDLNFAEHSDGKGLGLIGKNQHSQGTVGLHMHSTLAVGEDGVPLGVVRIEYDKPDLGGPQECAKPVEERTTGRWLRGLRDCVELTKELEGVRPVTVLDREGDVFALFAERERLGHVELLVRAKHNRALAGGSSKLFDELRQARLQATLEFDVGRQSARRSTQRQKQSEARPGRKAKVELRFGTVRLPAPDEDCPTLSVQAVHVREREPPKSGKRLEWLLLTTCPVRTREHAERVLQWYRLRWRIEDWHRVLKTGCKVEHLQHHTGERIERAVTISAVIAWRLMLMTLLGRQTPELPAEVLFTETELMVLRDFAHERKLPEPTNLGGAVRTMARMAGHLDRKGDAPPGHQKMWEGHADLSAAARAYGRILRLQQESLLLRKLSADG